MVLLAQPSVVFFFRHQSGDPSPPAWISREVVRWRVRLRSAGSCTLPEGYRKGPQNTKPRGIVPNPPLFGWEVYKLSGVDPPGIPGQGGGVESASPCRGKLTPSQTGDC